MKKTLLSGTLAIFIMLNACKKDDPETQVPPTPAPSVVGFWQGKYGGVSAYPTSGYSMLFRANATVRVFDGLDTAAASKAEGTYTVSGLTVNTTYTYLTGGISFSTTSAVDSKFTFLEGTYGSGAATSGTGRFFLNKK